jgi:hypothetical protein
VSLRTIFSIFAFIGFYASLLTHVTTFFGFNPAEYVLPLIGKDLWRKLFIPCPRWARYTIIAFAAYAPINFFIFFALSKGGSVDIRDGMCVLHNHGTVIKVLIEQECQRQQAYVLRGFSGHWMIFYLLPALHSWYRKD